MAKLLSVVAAAAMAVCAAAVAPTGLYGLDANVGLIHQYDNGTQVAIGSDVPNELQAQELASIDDKNGVYYFIGFNTQTNTPQLVGLDIASGKVVTNVALPFAESDFVGVGQFFAYCPDTGLVIASGQTANQTHIIGTVDPTSGAWTPITSISGKDLDVLGGATAYVPGGLFLFQLGIGDAIDTFALNMTTGNYTMVPGTDAQNIETMDYDPVTGHVFGLGLAIQGDSWNRTVVEMDPASLSIKTVGMVQGYGMESGGVAALNVQARTLYWIGAVQPYVNNAPFWLVQVSLADASVVSVSTAPLCTDDAECPWSYEMLN